MSEKLIPTSNPQISHKAAKFTESVIRDMTRLAIKHDAINLAQGFPNFAVPQKIKEAACRAIRADINQYAITWGASSFRQAIAKKYKAFYNWKIDPEREITVACGSTECMIASMLALVNPGEQVLVFEPFYENYGPDAILVGASTRYVSLNPEHNWAFDFEDLEQSIKDSQKEGGIRALILNTPNNPSGKVFSEKELLKIAELAQTYDFYVITDEIYEHLIYEGTHHPIACLPGMHNRTVTISGLSKTFSVTGWRVGYIIACSEVTNAIRKVHDFLTVGAPAPLQEAGADAMKMGENYYQKLLSDYRERRNYLIQTLQSVGFKTWTPSGAYYIMADISSLTNLSDVQFVDQLIKEYGVAAVPGSSFYHQAKSGKHFIRFAFCKTMDILHQAGERLQKLRS